MKIHKGDNVKVVSGNDRGKEGVVKQAFPKKGKILVEGVSLVKKHLKSSGEAGGGVVTVSRPIDVSRVMLVCPSCEKAVRVGYKIEGAKKYRVCKKCGEVIPYK